MRRSPFGNRRGAIALEFALVAPVFILLVLFTVDLVQFLRGQLRMEAVAAQLGQIASQCTEITEPGDSQQFVAFAQEIAGGLTTVGNLGGRGALVITAVYSQGGANRVAWQLNSGNTGHASGVGRTGGAARLPGDMVVPPGQTMLVAEAFATVSAWSVAARAMGEHGDRTIHATALFLSRATSPLQLQRPPTPSNTPVCTS